MDRESSLAQLGGEILQWIRITIQYSAGWWRNLTVSDDCWSLLQRRLIEPTVTDVAILKISSSVQQHRLLKTVAAR